MAAGVLILADFVLCMALFAIVADGANRAEARAYWRLHGKKGWRPAVFSVEPGPR